MVRATTRMLLPHKKVKEALNILKTLAVQSRAQPGCISLRLYGDLEEKNVILVEGMWQLQADLESYLRTDEYHTLLLVVEMALERPEIRFDTIAGSTGIETVEKARSSM